MNPFANIHETDRWHAEQQYGCPYYSAVTTICSASLSMMMTGVNTRRGYCENENYDNCPLFLSKLLRKKA